MDTVFNHLCLGDRRLDQDFRDYFVMGPDRASKREFPMSYRALIDQFLEFSEASIEYLNNLPEDKFMEPPAHNTKKNTETMVELIQRISLHFMGHTGQIYQTKRELGKGGTFVMGIKKKNRDDSKAKWLSWWNAHKNNYL